MIIFVFRYYYNMTKNLSNANALYDELLMQTYTHMYTCDDGMSGGRITNILKNEPLT